LVPNAAGFPAIERVTASVYPCVFKYFSSRKILFPYVQLLSAAYSYDRVGGVIVHIHWNNFRCSNLESGSSHFQVCCQQQSVPETRLVELTFVIVTIVWKRQSAATPRSFIL